MGFSPSWNGAAHPHGLRDPFRAEEEMVRFLLPEGKFPRSRDVEGFSETADSTIPDLPEDLGGGICFFRGIVRLPALEGRVVRPVGRKQPFATGPGLLPDVPRLLGRGHSPGPLEKPPELVCRLPRREYPTGLGRNALTWRGCLPTPDLEGNPSGHSQEARCPEGNPQPSEFTKASDKQR